jgi:hypothetical protein
MDYWLRCSYLPFIVFTLLTIILITFTFTDKRPIDSHPTTSDISTLVNTEDSHFRLIDMPLNITVLEEKNNRTDNGILNSTENYQLTSDTTRKGV